MAALDVNDGTDAWPVTNAYFRFSVPTRPGPWSGLIGRSDAVGWPAHVIDEWLAERPEA